MPDRHWKAEERAPAALFGGRRFPANVGAAADFETGDYVGQVKHVRRLSLAALEALALETERLGARRRPAKRGVVVVKRRAGRGQPTPRLVIVTEAAWRAIRGGRGEPADKRRPKTSLGLCDTAAGGGLGLTDGPATHGRWAARRQPLAARWVPGAPFDPQDGNERLARRFRQCESRQLRSKTTGQLCPSGQLPSRIRRSNKWPPGSPRRGSLR